MGLGFGLGQGYSDAERIFNPAAVPGFVIAPAAGAAPAAVSLSPLSFPSLADAHVLQASPYSGFNPFSSAGSDLVTKGSELVRSAKEAAGLAETKVEEAAEKVVEKVETKLEEKKKPQRWV
jgi:inner membrane organizing system protein 1